MINYIKMDLFRLFKSAGFYICSFILVLLMGITILEIKTIEKEGVEEEQATTALVGVSSEETGEVYAGMYMDSNEIARNRTLSSCIQSLYGGNTLLVIIILIMTLFICNEFSNGYVKNVITIPKYRWYCNVSKLVTALVVIVVENIIAILVFCFSVKFIFDSFIIGDVLELAGYLALEILLMLGLSAIVLLICNLIRNKAVCIILGFVLATQLLILPVLVLFCKRTGCEMATVSKFFMSVTSGNITPGMGERAVMETLALGIGGILLYTFFSNLLIKKKDIG